MQGWSVRVRLGLVVGLFLGSVILLLIDTFIARGLTRGRARIPDHLRESTTALAEAAAPLNSTLQTGRLPWDLDGQLHALTGRVLANFPGVEGGFYLVWEDRFAGEAFPTGLEGSSIRAQARRCMELGESAAQARGLVTGRVVVVTEPIGATRPARLVAWGKSRLTRPEDLESQIGRLWLSVTLALAGLGLSLALTVRLIRTIERQRAS
jgi:two-component system sensor histidine kinase HydH